MANATKRPKKAYHVRKARSLRETNNLERLKCKLFERMSIEICIYIYICTEHIEWDCREDPPMLGVCLGMWNFLDILHVRFMFIEPSKWPADQDAWFTLQLAGCILSKISKHHTLVPLSVKY